MQKTVSEEIWKDIEGYEGKYQVSNYGRVKSLYRKHHKYEIILKNKKTKDGYYETTLIANGKAKYIRTHRLVAMAFIPNPKNKPQINHKDGNKLNNYIENLEWCTNIENIRHAIKNGLEKLNGEENPNSKAIIQYDIEGNFIKRWGCIKYASDNLKIKQNNISQVCHQKRKTAGGYKWAFVKEGEC